MSRIHEAPEPVVTALSSLALAHPLAAEARAASTGMLRGRAANGPLRRYVGGPAPAAAAPHAGPPSGIQRRETGEGARLAYEAPPEEPVAKLMGASHPSGNESTAAMAPSEPLAGRDAFELDELVRHAQRGDRSAFTQLFQRHRTDVAKLVYRMMGPGADCEDVVQEIFLQVHKSLGEFRGQAKFTTWLHRVSVNVVLMARRAARSRPIFAGEPRAEFEHDTGLLPDEDAARQGRIAAFRRVLNRLPEKKRVVFELHELEGLAPSEIAELVDAPVLTVRTRLFYARREILAIMRDEPALAQLAAELAGESTETHERRSGGITETSGLPETEAR
jgi:RNA polymerase sigma-70 factor, ECF subfamily